MKWFINWVRRNAAVLIATSALVGVVAPELRGVSTAVSAAATAISAPSSEQVRTDVERTGGE